MPDSLEELAKNYLYYCKEYDGDEIECIEGDLSENHMSLEGFIKQLCERLLKEGKAVR